MDAVAYDGLAEWRGHCLVEWPRGPTCQTLVVLPRLVLRHNVYFPPTTTIALADRSSSEYRTPLRWPWNLRRSVSSLEPNSRD